MQPPQPTARILRIARIIARLKRHWTTGAPLPGRAAPLTYAEYITLVRRALNEHREE